LIADTDESTYIVGFIQYFYVSAKLGKAEKALSFIKQHNKPYKHYHCQNQKQINMTVFEFIKTFYLSIDIQ